MEQLIVQVKDTNSLDEPLLFFALAGIWQDRETTLESIRQQAWLRRKNYTQKWTVNPPLPNQPPTESLPAHAEVL